MSAECEDCGEHVLDCKCEERKITFCELHDACYCLECDQWLEAKCSDPECLFCHTRPDRPSQVMTEIN